jgi:A/G-specific adenine glycosylase
MNFDRIILAWYEKNKRDLPMRRTRDPYRTWVAEVIFQQTRISQGMDYYLKFLETFPDVCALASASEEEVLKRWQGLGYYNRALNLHSAARYIRDHLGGRMPGSYRELRQLRGVGKYTAAAIASFCYDEPVAAVDGNVSRVIARLYGLEEAVNSTSGARLIETLAGELLDREDPGTFNQAMIDFGALQCVPSSPDCSACPLARSCEAFITHRVGKIPVKKKKPVPAERWFCFYVMQCGTGILLTKRGTGDIWRSLYQFPMVEEEGPRTKEVIMGRMFRQVWEEREPHAGVTFRTFSPPLRHQLSHQTIHARFVHVLLKSLPRPLPAGWILVPLDELNAYPLPRLIQRYMESVNFFYL